MQQDEHVWAWYRHNRDAYMAQPLPPPEVSRFPWVPRWLVFNTQQVGEETL